MGLREILLKVLLITTEKVSLGGLYKAQNIKLSVFKIPFNEWPLLPILGPVDILFQTAQVEPEPKND